MMWPSTELQGICNVIIFENCSKFYLKHSAEKVIRLCLVRHGQLGCIQTTTARTKLVPQGTARLHSILDSSVCDMASTAE